MATAQPATRLRSASDAHRTQAALAAAAVVAARRQANRTPERIAQTIAAYQALAAQEAAASVTAMLAEQGIASTPVAGVASTALAGYSSTGAPLAAAVDAAGDLGLLAAGVVSDAFRQTQMVASVNRRQKGYVRMLNPPSCSRCVILAGATYYGNDGVMFHQVGNDWVKESNGTPGGFQRHPLCDCIMIPTSEDRAGDLTTDPRVYFDSLSPEEQDAGFGKAKAEAIRLGADMSQVVNATRGMRKAQVFGTRQWTTLVGTSARGPVGRLPVRLMPESILALAGADTDHALRLLKLYGYLL